MSAPPRVSFLVAVYNGEKHIEDCLASIKAQTYGDWEVVVVDDGSTDATAAILDAHVSDRLRVIRMAENRGVSVARNMCAREARGEFLAILDIDDLALPERLERQVAFLDAHPDHAAVGTYFRLESELGDAKIAKRGRLGTKTSGRPWCGPVLSCTAV